MKILVAEDNDSNYLLVKAILKAHNLTRAINGQIAVELLAKEDFDIVFMDMKMPVMDGLQATSTIRLTNKNIPIIALTANAFDSDRVNALEAGYNDFITKPLKKNELLEIIEKHCNK